MELSDYTVAYDLIKSSTSILLTTHARPDGDALGSIAGLQRSIDDDARLRGRNCRTQMLVLREMGDIYRFLLTEGAWITGENYREEDIAAGKLDEFDLIIVADTRAILQLPALGEYLVERKKRAVAGERLHTLVIDHHLTGDAIGTCELIDTNAGAAGEIVYELINQANWTIPPQAAEALFIAISTDTGWFRFENTRAKTMETVAGLIRLGAKPDACYQRMYLNHSPARLKLLGLALDSLELMCDNRLAIMKITQEMLTNTGATRPMIENMVNEPMQIASAVVCVVLVELEEGKTRCSLRSKHTLDCSELTARLGGGGHARAAGVTLDNNIVDARNRLVAAITEIFG